MNIKRDIQTLSEFKQNASKVVKQVQETRQPVVLTVNGKPAAVVQDVNSYQRMADTLEYRDTVAALREALSDIDNSDQWLTHEQAFDTIRAEYGHQKNKTSRG
jgi:prevent-host-death family protein